MMSKKTYEPSVVATPVIPALGRMRQKDLHFKANLGYMARSCLKN
jgi:hypothetical protein